MGQNSDLNGWGGAGPDPPGPSAGNGAGDADPIESGGSGPRTGNEGPGGQGELPFDPDLGDEGDLGGLDGGGVKTGEVQLA